MLLNRPPGAQPADGAHHGRHQRRAPRAARRRRRHGRRPQEDPEHLRDQDRHGPQPQRLPKAHLLQGRVNTIQIMDYSYISTIH